ncbi:MAG TPA: metallophosphoesterase family protein [Lichenihabitans sp.]|nr:metallophosphoesterase family protein [Lichenihabitans sp.]
MSRSFFHRLVDRFRRLRPAGPHAAPVRSAALPEGLRIYAIGDVHGHADLLDRMASRIEADLARNPAQDARAVFVGDYIDRGPDSAGVIERLASGRFPLPFETLRGNHEDVLIGLLAAPVDALGASLEHWYQLGGLETLRSYGVDVGKAASGKSPDRMRRAFLDRFPEAHRAFLLTTRLSLTLGDYFLVHAGARPGVPLDVQSPEDLMWIREDCYRSDYDFGKVLVHGHTPRRAPENLPRRINVDTGAFKWGVLSAVALEADTRRFLSTRD